MPSTRIVLFLSAALAAPCALAAVDNYTIALRTETSGRDIVVNATPGPVAAVQVSNRTSTRVRCFVDYLVERVLGVESAVLASLALFGLNIGIAFLVFGVLDSGVFIRGSGSRQPVLTERGTRAAVAG